MITITLNSETHRVFSHFLTALYRLNLMDVLDYRADYIYAEELSFIVYMHIKSNLLGG